MKLVPSIVVLLAVSAASVAAGAQTPVARAPGLVVALDGRIYVQGEAVARGDQPAWSPDGTRLAFVRGGSIYVADDDGRNERRLTRGGSATSPAWSPDGARIAFAGARDLFTVAVATGELARVTRTREPWLGNFAPSYSPDGSTIAFSRSTDAFNNDIFLVRSDGTKLRRLTRSQGTESRLGEETMPAWSRDGRTIVFVSNRDGNWELYSISRDGSAERRLTRTRANEESPRYRRDGAGLLYVRDGRVVVARADGRPLRVLGRGTAADWR
jgi:TolB protein